MQNGCLNMGWGRRARQLIATITVMASVLAWTATPPPAKASLDDWNLTRISSDIPLTWLALPAMGYLPTCIGNSGANPELGPAWFGGEFAASHYKDVQLFDWNFPAGAEALAACEPTLILAAWDVGPEYYGGVLEDIVADVPKGGVIYTNAIAGAVGCTGSYLTCTTWKSILSLLGQRLSIAMDDPQPQERANTAIANIDRRTAALRPHVEGKKYAWINPSGGFRLFGSGWAWMGGVQRDLGIENVVYDLPSSLWSPDPSGQTSVTYSIETLPEVLGGADLIIADTWADDFLPISESPLWQALPAVQAGHFAGSPNLTGNTPFSHDLAYRLIANAFGLKEYSVNFASESGPWGPKSSFILDPASRKVCWAISPKPGTPNPSGAITASVGGGPMVTLSASPTYVDPEASDPAGGTTWQTSPETFQTSGCATLSSADASGWVTEPESVRIRFGGVDGVVQAGPADFTTGQTLPQLTSQPQSATVDDGIVASFSATGTGSRGLAATWQASRDDGQTWSQLGGATTTVSDDSGLSSLQVKGAPRLDGQLYRAVFMTPAGVAYSQPAKLTVRPSASSPPSERSPTGKSARPAIKGQPRDVTVTVGKRAKFTARASGLPTPTVRWQFRTNKGKNGTKWRALPGRATSYTTPKVKWAWSGRQYRAVFTNAAGRKATRAATLTVTKR